MTQSNFGKEDLTHCDFSSLTLHRHFVPRIHTCRIGEAGGGAGHVEVEVQYGGRHLPLPHLGQTGPPLSHGFLQQPANLVQSLAALANAMCK
eukprot:2462065-Amphidinium_carterae.1